MTLPDNPSDATDYPDSRGAHDPLSEWLGLMTARCTLSGSLRAFGSWSIAFDTDATKIIVVTEGKVWLVHPQLPAPLRLSAGDGFMLTRPDSYVICTDPDIPPRSAHEVFVTEHGYWNGGDGSPFHALGCNIALDAIDAELLLSALPVVIPVSGAHAEARTLRWLITRLAAETAMQSPGSATSAGLMTQLLFVETIRFHMQSTRPEFGYLAALRDDRIAAALRLIHTTPEQAWRLDDLAATIGMSRSSFAARFKQLTGQAPAAYLLRWRMRLAAQSLQRTQRSIARIAETVGFQSDTALSHAFKRVYGVSPAVYRRTAQVRE